MNDKNSRWEFLAQKFHEKSDMYDKQLFYYNIAIITVMIFIIQKIYDDNAPYPIILIAIVIILICGISTICLLKTLNITRNILEMQMSMLYENDVSKNIENIESVRKLSSQNKFYNKIAKILFYVICTLTILYLLCGSWFMLDLQKKDYNNSNIIFIHNMSQNFTPEQQARIKETVRRESTEIKSFTPTMTPQMYEILNQQATQPQTTTPQNTTKTENKK